MANGGVARITKGIGVEKQGTVFGKNGEILSSELGLVKFVPETNSYIIKPESTKMIGDGTDWFSEINASQPNKGRIWSQDGFKKIEFEKMPDGAIEFTTTEWTPPQAVARLKQATPEEIPGLIKAIGEGPKPDTPTPVETFTIKNQEIPKTDVAPKNQATPTTTILEKLGDRETVSKEFISNLTNSGDVKQQERDIIRSVLEKYPEKVNVAEFKNDVEAELVPLTTKETSIKTWDTGEETRYESITLQPEVRGNVKDYKENIYESPAVTSAGDIHFAGKTKNYFGHTRVEDMADGTRRIIEVQSDLYQRDRLDNKRDILEKDANLAEERIANKQWGNGTEKEMRPILQQQIDDFTKYKKLYQYGNPTAHFRMVREEIAKAVKDGVKSVQFPTGETAMKIEGLGGYSHDWKGVTSY